VTELIKIGNSHGIRIPKPLIEQAELKNKQLELKIVKNGLLIRPVKLARTGWENSVREALAEYDSQHKLSNEEQDWLDTPNELDEDLEW